jgi:hypothetical protein
MIAGRVHFTCALVNPVPHPERGPRPSGRVGQRNWGLLSDIDAVAAERDDDGRFDDLSVKSVAHFVLAEAGRAVASNSMRCSRGLTARQISRTCASCATQAPEGDRDGNFGFPDRSRPTGLGATVAVAAFLITVAADPSSDHRASRERHNAGTCRSPISLRSIRATRRFVQCRIDICLRSSQAPLPTLPRMRG